MDYKTAGVDIVKADELVKYIGLSGFGADIDVKTSWTNCKLVMSTDGVGTKILIADELQIYDTIGIDLVAMCVNDILCHGARPVAFLDYYATGKLNLNKSKEILDGIKKGCEIAGCPLVGGETAEMPGLYKKSGVGTFDLAGFALGIAEKNNYRPSVNLKPKKGDALIGIPSSGLHANGFSLIRKMYKEYGIGYHADLLKPTRIYVDDILPVIDDITAIANITGGGIHNNLPRILLGLSYDIELEYDQFFSRLLHMSKLPKLEFESIFNCGIGMILVVDKNKITAVLNHIIDAKILGEIISYES